MELFLSFARFLVPLGFLIVVLGMRLFWSRPRALVRALELRDTRAGRLRGQLPGGGLISVAVPGLWSRKLAGAPMVGECPGGRLVVRPKKAGEGAPPVPTGDAEFDRTWWVEGDELLVRAIFNAQIRSLFHALHGTGFAIHHEHFSAQNLDPAPTPAWTQLLTEVLPLFSQTSRSLLAERLTATVQEDPSESTRALVLSTLLEHGLTTHKLLQQAAHSELPAVRVPAMIALQGKDPSLEPALIALLQDPRARSAAISGLQRIGTAQAVMPLRALPGTESAILAIQTRVGSGLKGALELAQSGGELEIVGSGGEIELVSPQDHESERDISDKDISLQ